MDHLRE
jgi:predicted nuclease of predicted toxin-antitoxin system